MRRAALCVAICLLATDAIALTPRRFCRDRCGPLIASCIVERRPLRCRTRWIRGCRRFGPEFCALPTTTTQPTTTQPSVTTTTALAPSVTLRVNSYESGRDMFFGEYLAVHFTITVSPSASSPATLSLNAFHVT